MIDLAKFKKWIISKIDKSQAQHISSSFNVSDLVGKILAARGFKCDEKIKSFLNKNADEFHNPFLLHDMENAVKEVDKEARKTIKTKPQPQLSMEMQEFINVMEHKFSTKINVKGNEKKGKIIINYYNSDDLDRIYDIIATIH